MKTQIFGIAVITALVIGIGAIAIPVDDAEALRDVAQNARQGANTQEGVVNANVQAQVQAGGVCVQALNSDSHC
jgi:hypothetical protein